MMFVLFCVMSLYKAVKFLNSFLILDINKHCDGNGFNGLLLI